MGLGIFLIVAAIVFGFFFSIWGKSNNLNLFLKFMFFCMTIWNILCILYFYGLIGNK